MSDVYLADSCRDELKGKSGGKRDSKSGDDIISSLLNSLDEDMDMDVMLR